MTRPLVLLVACVVLGAGCRTVVDPAVLADAQIAARVRTALVNHPELGRMPVDVRVRQGVARLSGAVETDAQASEAAQLVRGVQGVRDVEIDLQIGGAAEVPLALPAPPALSDLEGSPGDRRLLALGASVSRSDPQERSLASRVSVGPLLRLGSGRGLGVAIGFSWFHAALVGSPSDPGLTGRVHVKPIMGGLGYTFRSGRVSLAPSVVGGMAFNRASASGSGPTGRVAVSVGNSFAWRPGVSVWLDLNRWAAVNLSAAQVRTGLDVTFVDDGHLVRERVPGNAVILQAGLAYKIF
jgi:hypothetical protein